MRVFQAINPSTGERLDPPFTVASAADVDRVCTEAARAFEPYSRTAPGQRAALLRRIASGLEEAGVEIVERAQLETALPLARLQAELGRTCNQLRLFADLVEEGSWVDARIETRPNVRSMRRPLGPVAVFGASNFPLAFSTAGGDTVSALAAGNPVIVKAHPAHPGTAERVGRVIAVEVGRLGLPSGTFAQLFDDGFEVGQALVGHPAIRAVGFTGSRRGGEALMKLAAARRQPIPVYAEMGSVNPVVILPGALRERASAIAEGLHASFTQGVGQFCTNPGTVFVPEGHDGDRFVEMLAAKTRGTPAGAMLTTAISTAYAKGAEALRNAGAEEVARGARGELAACGEASLFQIHASRAVPEVFHEVFGPSTLVVRYGQLAELERLVDSLEGQLSAAVHALSAELREHAPLLQRLERKAGRLIVDQFPTGVDVNHAMIHGGPYPATSDGQSTSVGTHAIERFTRFVAYQNFPDEALPEELREANPRGIWRMVDGERMRNAVRLDRP